jgi:hypothetical protein
MHNFDTFSNWLFDRVFTDQRVFARSLADWIIHQIEKPVKLLARPKSERPANYEVIEPPQPGQYD